MKNKTTLRIACSCLGLTSLYSVPAQAQVPKPDSPEVLAHIEKAKKVAGAFWAREEHFLCEDPNATIATDPGPSKLFDNLYVIPGTYGVSNAVVYVITTSAGLMLIDAGSAKDVQTVLLPGLRTLGFDPANIKVVILNHGHADHYGGAAWLQEHYSGLNIYMAAADWDFIAKPTRAGATAPVLPRRDRVAVQGQPIILGDERVTPVFIPGHTPGSLGLIFPVTDGGMRHVAAIVGGGFLVPRQPDLDRQFIQSLAHFRESTERMHADVELMPHPVMDGFGEKLATVGNRKPGQPNPFIVGRGNYTKFLDVMSECAKASLARNEQ
jgi:metallo-beta-lactamase class B